MYGNFYYRMAALTSAFVVTSVMAAGCSNGGSAPAEVLTDTGITVGSDDYQSEAAPTELPGDVTDFDTEFQGFVVQGLNDPVAFGDLTFFGPYSGQLFDANANEIVVEGTLVSKCGNLYAVRKADPVSVLEAGEDLLVRMNPQTRDVLWETEADVWNLVEEHESRGYHTGFATAETICASNGDMILSIGTEFDSNGDKTKDILISAATGQRSFASINDIEASCHFPGQYDLGRLCRERGFEQTRTDPSSAAIAQSLSGDYQLVYAWETDNIALVRVADEEVLRWFAQPDLVEYSGAESCERLEFSGDVPFIMCSYDDSNRVWYRWIAAEQELSLKDPAELSGTLKEVPVTITSSPADSTASPEAEASQLFDETVLAPNPENANNQHAAAGILPPSDPATGCTVVFGTAPSDISIRAEHNESSGIVATVPAGSEYEYEQCPNPGWVRAAYGGIQGWFHSN